MTEEIKFKVKEVENKDLDKVKWTISFWYTEDEEWNFYIVLPKK